MWSSEKLTSVYLFQIAREKTCDNVLIFKFFSIKTSEQHIATDLVNLVYYPTGLV